ncbi:fla cluster protein FlaF [Halorussus halophilus]|uniref:fla cluster protein FlaF n=1 Tax=Halorussus halophilus TaxID=2650975 RepID=UPI00130166E8|nr:fla cluster protein FlaF [Halorussus halophilus]
MGFSVSGATVVIFLGIFISFGMAYTAANNGMERVNDAYEGSQGDALEQQNTALSIVSTSVGNAGGETYLTVEVNNTGSTTLSVDDTDILIEGVYRPHTEMETLNVSGNKDTNLWLPGETLQFNTSVSTTTPRVKVVTESGVAAAKEAL